MQERLYHLLTGENKLFCNMRSGLNDLLLRASVSRLSKFVPWIYQCLNTDLNSSQAFKRATRRSSLKPFRKEGNRDGSLISVLSVQKHTHTQLPCVGLCNQQFASCFPSQGSQHLVFRAFADVRVEQRQPPAILKKKWPSGPHLLLLQESTSSCKQW